MSLTTWLISYYKFDEWSWTTAFDSVGSNDWTLVSSPTWTTTSKLWPYALSFSWWNHVSLSNLMSFNNNAFSFGCWIRPATINTRWWIFIKWTGQGNRDLAIFQDNQDIRVTIYQQWTPTTFAGVRINGVLSVNQWFNISLTYDGSGNRSWINLRVNNQLHSVTEWVTSINRYTNNDNARFWADTFWENWNFNWILDEVWIWNRVLTASEITELYNSWDWLQYPFTSESSAWFLMRNF